MGNKQREPETVAHGNAIYIGRRETSRYVYCPARHLNRNLFPHRCPLTALLNEPHVLGRRNTLPARGGRGRTHGSRRGRTGNWSGNEPRAMFWGRWLESCVHATRQTYGGSDGSDLQEGGAPTLALWAEGWSVLVTASALSGERGCGMVGPGLRAAAAGDLKADAVFY